MKSAQFLIYLFLAALLAGSCGKTSMKKTPGGMPYKLYKGNGKDTTLLVGKYVKLSLAQKINDSLIFTTANGVPVYLFISNMNQEKYDIAELWPALHLGDSIVTTQMMDTFIKRNPQAIPPQFRNGDRIITNIKVLAFFESDSLARLDEEKEKQGLNAREILFIEKYLTDKKIQAQKTPSGAFLQVLNPGSGTAIDSGNFVTVNYTGTSWEGIKFDSNTDSAFGHVQPFSFEVGSGQMIRGFDEAVRMLLPGGKGRAYLPSHLAYGPYGSPPRVKPFENLIFDLEVTGVLPKAPADKAKKINPAQQNK